MPTKRKPAKAKKAKTPRKERRDFSQVAWDVVQQATGAKPKTSGIKPKL